MKPILKEKPEPMRTFRLVACVGLGMLVCGAAEKPPEHLISIAVTAQGDDLQDRVASVVTRELRKYSDVRIVPVGQETIKISLIAYYLRAERSAAARGYVFSVLVVRSLNSAGVHLFEGHAMYKGSLDGLDEALREVVASVDRGTLEGERLSEANK